VVDVTPSDKSPGGELRFPTAPIGTESAVKWGMATSQNQSTSGSKREPKAGATPSPTKKSSSSENASAQATKAAAKGEPLVPEKGDERSPKQENL
jgi:hypothetical protein